VGGHTNSGGCLHRTAKSARERGYTILCVEDATFDAGESTRVPGIRAAGFDHIVSTETFLDMAAAAAKGD
jgi:nicotinamidase-related amidase